MNNKYKAIIIMLVVLVFYLLLIYISGARASENLIEVKKGDTFFDVARKLSENNIIRSRSFFIFAVKLTGQSRNLKVGYYKFSKARNIFNIITVLTKGDIANRVFTVPEGFNIFQIASLLEKKGIASREDFVNAALDRRILRKYKINQNSVEGFLYPDTYFIPYNISAYKIINLMIENFYNHINQDYIKKLKKSYGSIEKAIIIASLVEWEAQVDYERPIIAGVFLNRLKNNINLQSCATVMYSLNNHKPRLLFRDLKVKSPYNTYIYKGLPPTPICNPSEKSILAVIYPAKVNYNYFVSMQDGRHYFSSSYSKHLRAYKYFILKDNSINPYIN